jgi:glutamyl-tRNA synthetase
MTQQIRTRFAPSPTGYLHVGGARTALFSWAFARHFGGEFVLRIEDTDVERSTPEAVEAILSAMHWLDLGYDEGPFFQMQRIDRYRSVIAEMLLDGRAYYCYASPAELDVMREGQRLRGEKPRYDGRWRPAPGKVLPAIPEGGRPVVRFANPETGTVRWNDMIKGEITISNLELDDLIIARSDGTPTYNFCVCVDDWDMQISHVIRGEEHVNNTPRQINILNALGATTPTYGHVPLILGPDGHKLSKRTGTVGVMQYEADGILPEALINYLARLGWSHGDSEVFSRAEMVAWFDGHNVAASPAQWDAKKLIWLNHHYIKAADNHRLAALVRPRLEAVGVSTANGPDLVSVVGLLKDRAETLVDLARASVLFFQPYRLDPALVEQHVPMSAKPALQAFLDDSAEVVWDRATISALIKTVLTRFSMKMPQLAAPLRIFAIGSAQAPSVDAVLELIGRETVRQRLKQGLEQYLATSEPS